ncbi:MAG: CRTAC1 family protein [Bacteroidota bacterium]
MKHDVLTFMFLLLGGICIQAQTPAFEIPDEAKNVMVKGKTFTSSWGDFDNDGCIDLFLVNGNWPDQNAANQLFRNNCDGTFTEVNVSLFEQDIYKSANAAWGDYDHDGFKDLLVGNASGQPINLYHNMGNGQFERVVNPAFEASQGDHFVYWFDYDGDGWMDAYLANEEGSDKLLRNKANGQWQDAFEEVEVPFEYHRVSTRGMALADVDNDGDLDVFLASNRKNSLNINEGNGKYRLAEDSRVTIDIRGSNTALFEDLDNDGDPDLIVGTDNGARNTMIYENQGDAGFRLLSSSVIFRDRPNSYAICPADYDLDGDIDLFFACSFGTAGRANAYYENQGNLEFRFRDLGPITRVNLATAGASTEDFDNDGDVDIYLAHLGENINSILFENTTPDRHFLNLHLVDDLDSMTVMGTKVQLKTVIQGESRWQYRTLAPTASYGQSSQDIIFGLDQSLIIDSLRIIWPDGDSCIFTQLDADQFLTVFSSCKPAATIPVPVDTPLLVVLDTIPEAEPVVVVEPSKPKPKAKPRLRYTTIKNPKENQLVKVKKRSLKLQVWDDDLVDGDVVTIKVGGKTVVSDCQVKKQKARFTIKLPSNSTTLEMIAVDEGKLPPNTAVIRIDDGLHRQTIYMKASKAKSGKLRLQVRK